MDPTLQVNHNPGRQSGISTFRPTHRGFKGWNLISKTGFVSVTSPLSFELIELAIQLLLGCQSDAESFLSAEHSVVGEIEDALAQAYAALGMACVCIFRSEE